VRVVAHVTATLPAAARRSDPAGALSATSRAREARSRLSVVLEAANGTPWVGGAILFREGISYHCRPSSSGATHRSRERVLSLELRGFQMRQMPVRQVWVSVRSGRVRTRVRGQSLAVSLVILSAWASQFAGSERMGFFGGFKQVGAEGAAAPR
jgi:hypothetical protein